MLTLKAPNADEARDERPDESMENDPAEHIAPVEHGSAPFPPPAPPAPKHRLRKHLPDPEHSEERPAQDVGHTVNPARARSSCCGI